MTPDVHTIHREDAGHMLKAIYVKRSTKDEKTMRGRRDLYVNGLNNVRMEGNGVLSRVLRLKWM